MSLFEEPRIKLYEISTAYRLLADQIDQCEELTDDQLAALAHIEAELPAKVDAYCALRREWEAYADAADEEAKRLKALAQVKRNAATRIWDALATELERMGLRQYRTARFHCYFQKNPPGCTVDNPLMLPTQFQRLKIEADSRALIDTWKDGKPLPDGVTVSQGVSLRLK